MHRVEYYVSYPEHNNCSRELLVNEQKRDFDLIFFHTDEMPYSIVQTACRSYWCHIGLILLLSDDEIEIIRELTIRCKEYSNINNRGDKNSTKIKKKYHNNNNSNKRPYLLESTTDDYPCVITGSTKMGVKICLLEDRIEGLDPNTYCGYKKVSIKKVNQATACKNILLYDLLPCLIGKPYEKNLARLAKAWVHYYFSSTIACTSYNESSMFCTELITHIFTKLKLLNARHYDDSEDNYDSNKDDNPIPLFNSCCCCCCFTSILSIKTNHNFYTDEDLVLEDYVTLEEKFLNRESSWLFYDKLKILYFGSEK